MYASCDDRAPLLVLSRWCSALPRPLLTRSISAKVLDSLSPTPDGGADLDLRTLRSILWGLPPARRLTLTLLVLSLARVVDNAAVNGASLAIAAAWLAPLLFHTSPENDSNNSAGNAKGGGGKHAAAVLVTGALLVFAEGMLSQHPKLVSALPSCMANPTLASLQDVAREKYAAVSSDPEGPLGEEDESDHGSSGGGGGRGEEDNGGGKKKNKQGGDDHHDLPPGWSAHFDDNYGRYFYSNKDTNETSWTRPKINAASSSPSSSSETSTTPRKSVLETAGDDDDNNDDDDDGLEDENSPSATDSLRAVRMALHAITNDDVDEFKAALLAPGFPVLAGACQFFSMASASSFVDAIVELFMDTGDILELISLTIQWELDVTLSAGTLFRGNSMSTKIMVAFTRKICGRFLEDTFLPLFRVLVEAVESAGPLGLEIDPTRKKIKSKVIKANLAVLHDMTQLFLDGLFASVRSLPREMRVIAHTLHRTTGKKFPQMRSIVVGGYIFLRIVCPFLNSPTAFDVNLDVDVTEPRVRAALLLISKTLQNLANGVRYTTTKPHLIPLNDFIDANISSITRYFDEVAVVPKSAATSAAPPHVGLLSREQETETWAKVLAFFADRVDPLREYADELAGLAAAEEDEAGMFGTLQLGKIGTDLKDMLTYSGGPVFGASLQQLLLDDELGETAPLVPNVPNVLTSWLEWLEQLPASACHGLFERNPPFHRVAQLRRLQEMINAGARPTFVHGQDPPENVAWLVKTFFTSLAEPLLSARILGPLIKSVAKAPTTPEPELVSGVIAPLVDVLGELPVAHLATASRITAFLSRMLSKESTPDSLGAVFGPIWLPPPDGQGVSGEIYAAVNALAATLIAVPDLVATSDTSRQDALRSLTPSAASNLPLVRVAASIAGPDGDDASAQALDVLESLSAQTKRDADRLVQRITALASTLPTLRTERGVRDVERVIQLLHSMLDDV